MLKDKYNLAILFLLFLAFTFIGFYFFQFRDSPISQFSNDWGNFGSFIAPVFSAITLAIMIYAIKETRLREFKKDRKDKFELLIKRTLELDKNYLERDFEKLKENRVNKIGEFKTEINKIIVDLKVLVLLNFKNEIGGIIYPYYHLTEYLIVNNILLTDKQLGEYTKYLHRYIIPELLNYSENESIYFFKNEEKFMFFKNVGYRRITEGIGIDPRKPDPQSTLKYSTS